MSVFQGKSWSTHSKERDLEDLVALRLTMLRRFFDSGVIDHMVIADVFCGSGENQIGGEVIDGSPLSILNGIQKACQSSFRPFVDRINLIVSDVREHALQNVDKLVADKFEIRPDLFAVNTYRSLVHVQRADAGEQISALHQSLRARRRDRLFLFIDPNGPRDLPYPEVASLLADPECRGRVDAVVNISATALKRLNSNHAAQVNISEWVGRFDNIFIEALPVDGASWVRCPQGDVWQWCVLAYWGAPAPFGDWRKRGFRKLSSPEGRQAIEHYATTRKQKRAM